VDIATNGVAWSVGRSVRLPITTVNPAEAVEPFGMLLGTMYLMGAQISSREGALLGHLAD